MSTLKKPYRDPYTVAFPSLRMRNFLMILAGLSGIFIAGGSVVIFGPLTLFAVVGLILAVLIFRYPILGILLFVGMIPLESSFFAIWSGGATYTRLLGFYILGLWALRLLIERRPVKIPASGKWLIPFLIWSLLSMGWSIDHKLTLQYWLTLIQMFALYLLIYNEITTQKQLSWILSVLVVSCTTAALLGYFRIASLGAKSLLTLESHGAKEYSSMVGTAFLSGVILFSSNVSKRLKLFSLLVMAICIYPLFAAGERGVFVGFLTGWLGVLLVRKGKVGNLILTLLLGLLIFGAFQWAAQNGLVSNFIIYRFSLAQIQETGGTGRLDIWRVAFNIIRDHALLGVGLGNFSLTYLRYAPAILKGPYAYMALGPHSDYIGILAELGLVGFVLFIGLLSSVWVRLVRLLRGPLLSEMTVLAAWLAGLWVYSLTIGLTTVLMYRKFYWLLFVLVEVVIKLYREKRDIVVLPEQNTQHVVLS